MRPQLLLDREFDERLSTGYGGRFFGVYPALVTDLGDPKGLGRVKVCLPWSPDSDDGNYEVWARLATLMGGNNRGSWFVPDEKDEVLVVFQAGDTRWPFVIGGLWNGVDAPPEQMQHYREWMKQRNLNALAIDALSHLQEERASEHGGVAPDLHVVVDGS